MRVRVIRGSADMLNDRLVKMEEYNDAYEVLEDMNSYMVIQNTRTNNIYSFKREKLEKLKG